MNEHNDILKALRQQMKEHDQHDGPFHVPEDYFPELENKILATVSDEAAADPMIFTNEGKRQTFTVPDGYFDDLGQNILKKTTSPASVRRLFTSKWQQIAAATITGLIVLSGIYYRESSDSRPIAIQNQPNSTPAIRNISVNELTDFVEDAATGNIKGNDKKIPLTLINFFNK
ncbi:hypothetical protein [Niabella hibiscisoli]|uniref:hypothetical protein n=1 Tax=Niabella hibiscisoli TaxID=1825928 RepID=UPI001F0DDA04|nr:hypothetical protein [Niabella hibiscisoli]MCH5715115.1 hypothetical protein [Niabella hibiscisoli]